MVAAAPAASPVKKRPTPPGIPRAQIQQREKELGKFCLVLDNKFISYPKGRVIDKVFVSSRLAAAYDKVSEGAMAAICLPALLHDRHQSTVQGCSV